MTRLLTTSPGRCTHCERRREVYRISRHGGGTYRRGGRSYWSSICGPCAIDLAAYWSRGHSLISRYDASRIREIAAALTGVFAA